MRAGGAGGLGAVAHPRESAAAGGRARLAGAAVGDVAAAGALRRGAQQQLPEDVQQAPLAHRGPPAEVVLCHVIRSAF